MADVVPLPRNSDVIVDARGGDRWMRITWHQEDDVVVLSLWHGDRCSASFRLDRDDVPDLVHTLVAGLTEQHQAAGRALR